MSPLLPERAAAIEPARRPDRIAAYPLTAGQSASASDVHSDAQQRSMALLWNAHPHLGRHQ